MVNNNNNNGGANNNQQQAAAEGEEEETAGPVFMDVVKMLGMFLAFQVIVQSFVSSFGHYRQQYAASKDAVSFSGNTNNNSSRIVPLGVTSSKSTTSNNNKMHNSLWDKGTSMDLNVYISEHKDSWSEKHTLASWHESNILFDNVKSNERNISLSVDVSPRVHANQTIVYAHVMLTRNNNNDNGNGSSTKKKKQVRPKANSMDTVINTIELTRYKLKKKKRQEKNLLGDKEQDDNNGFSEMDLKDDTVFGKAARDDENDVTLLYLKPTLTLQLVNYYHPYLPGTFPPHILRSIHLYNDDDTTATPSTTSTKVPPSPYYPILHPSEFWIKADSLIPVNGTLTNVTIDMSLTSIQMMKWNLMAQMEEQWKTQETMSGGDTGESDMLRSLLLDTNPILLVVTAIVTLLHTVFDILAFKNDISFFKGKRSMEGISVRSMVINAFFQIVIFFYLLDNDTSYMVLMSNGVGLLIEFWKITKAINFTFQGGRLQWEQTTAYSQSKTKEYDETATSHLMYVTMPLVSGYGVYSLIHMKHKGWYSWILGTLVGFIYMFGFVMMTPQLFINYKLQSVAHLNWRTMTYKSVNTFIDDLFAFVIKMPIMHRLACLRDDIIFVVFLYQRYKYQTDYTRVNEFGQCEQPTEEMLKEVEAENKKKRDVSSGTGTVTKTRRGARDKI